jgi:hypothetical protein
MGIFKNLETKGLEQNEDRVGGYNPLDSDLYTGTIKLAYAGQSAKGARSVTVHAEVGGQEYRETIYITNRNGEPFWTNDNGKKSPLPGFTVINDICIAATDKPLEEQETEEKQVKLYDFDERKEVLKGVDVLIDLLDKPIALGILNILQNKSVKQGDGSYADGPEEQNINQIDKVFHAETKMTVKEALDAEGWDADKADFHQKWIDKNAGKVRDKRTIKDGQGGTAGKPGGSAPTGGGERKTLFGKKD